MSLAPQNAGSIAALILTTCRSIANASAPKPALPKGAVAGEAPTF